MVTRPLTNALFKAYDEDEGSFWFDEALEVAEFRQVQKIHDLHPVFHFEYEVDQIEDNPYGLYVGLISADFVVQLVCVLQQHIWIMGLYNPVPDQLTAVLDEVESKLHQTLLHHHDQNQAEFDCDLVVYFYHADVAMVSGDVIGCSVTREDRVQFFLNGLPIISEALPIIHHETASQQRFPFVYNASCFRMNFGSWPFRFPCDVSDFQIM